MMLQVDNGYYEKTGTMIRKVTIKDMKSNCCFSVSSFETEKWWYNCG